MLQQFIRREREFRLKIDRRITSSSDMKSAHKMAFASLYLSVRSRLLQRAVHLGLRVPDGLVVLMNLALKNCDTVLDIGANVGWVTERASWLVGASGHVYSFEPSPTTRCYLQRRLICMGLTNVEICPLALGEASGQAVLHEFAENFGGSSSLAFGPETAPGQSLRTHTVVEVSTLDSYVETNQIKPIRLVKIDVQGAELQVLKGASLLFSAIDAPIMYIEVEAGADAAFGYRPANLLDVIASFGYTMYSWRKDGLVSVRSEHDIPDDGHDDLICLKLSYPPHNQLYKQLSNPIRRAIGILTS